MSTLKAMDNEKFASESARRVIELMTSNGHALPADLCNSLADTACFVNNVDAALAMVEAMSRAGAEVKQETYVDLLDALMKDKMHLSSEEVRVGLSEAPAYCLSEIFSYSLRSSSLHIPPFYVTNNLLLVASLLAHRLP